MIKTLLAALVAAVIAHPVQAQDFAMGQFNNSMFIMDGYVGQAAMASVANSAAARAAQKDGAAQKDSGPGSPRRSLPPTAPSSLTFSNDPSVARDVRARFRRQLVGSNPARTTQIDAALQRDWLRGYATDVARPNGLDPRNLADSHAAYLIASWALVNGVTTLSPGPISAVRDKVRGDLMRDPKVAGLSPAQKQAMGEELNYNTVLVMANRQRIHEASDRALQAAAARHYEAQFAKLGVNLRQIKLTEAGFAAR